MIAKEKTREQLISELEILEQRLQELEKENVRLKQLQIGELYYQDIVEGQTELICRLLPDGTHTYVNRVCCEYFGKKFEELIGQNIMSFIPKSEHHKVKSLLESLNQENPVGKIEHQVIMPNGDIRWQQWVDRAIFDHNGQIIEIQTVGRDITDRKRVEERLGRVHHDLEVRVKERTRELEKANEDLKIEIAERVMTEEKLRKLTNEFQMIFKALPDLYFRYAEDGTVLDYKAGRLCDLYAPGESILGNKVQEILPMDVGMQYLHAIQRVLKTKALVKIDYSLVLKIGKCFFEARLVPLSEDQVIAIVCNITERQRMEEELLKSRQLESLGILAGGIAHDFNNILMGILGNILLAKRYVDPEDRVYKKLLRVERISLQAKDLSHQLLTFAKGGDPVKQVLFIGKMIKDSVDLALRGANVRCEFVIKEDLLPVEIDEGQISRVINNLIINARQAMPNGGVIKVVAENIFSEVKHDLALEDGKYIKIAIEDQGMGIAKTDIQHIFDPYFTTKPDGTGLGLAVCYSIVKKHKGQIAVESKLGQGTTFFVYLPACEKSISYQQDIEMDALSMGNGKILIMDDDEMIRDITGEMLSHMGYQFEVAKEGIEAIELYVRAKENGCPFDIVIMDLTIPGGMGGEETIKNLAKIDPNVKAVVASGYYNDPVVSESKEYGFKGFITKPFSMEELSKTIREVILK